MRGQANLAALVVALVLLTSATVVGVTIADAALADADREPLERHAATAVADRLVATDAPTTVRSNALNASTLDDLNASRLADIAPPARSGDVRVALDGEVVVERGAPGGGATVRRSVVVVSRAAPAQVAANLSRSSVAQVPRGVARATVRVDAGPNTTVRTVRANGRVVLYDGGGLDTPATVHLARYEPTTLRVDAGGNATGRLTVTYRPRLTTSRTLTVTVDA
ncbi:MAG: hypothetical protein ABEJ73_06430 [Haloplanus sp.]